MKKSSLSALLLIISLTLIPACSLITAIMLAADGVLEDPQTPATPVTPPTTPATPTPPAAQGSLIPLAGHNSPTGIWSDGTTMWVADWEDAKIYAYTMSTKTRDSAKDFTTLAAAAPRGIWSDGTTMWAADYMDNKIYAYSMADKTRDSAKDFNTLIASAPRGIWSDGTTMWAADYVDNKIYAYSMATKARDSAKDFTTLTAAGNTSPEGIWSDGTTMWVTDYVDDKIYAYSMADKTRDGTKDLTALAAAGNTNPKGIWSDGTTMWAADPGTGKIHAYSMPRSASARDSAKDFDTLSTAGNGYPGGLWSDGTTMWVSDATDAKIYAYSMSTKARDRVKDFNTLAAPPQGADPEGTSPAAGGNTNPKGIWSDGTTMWVADDVSRKIYAYSMSTKARDRAKDFNIFDSAAPQGIWSDGITMWVAGGTNGIYAYSMATKARDRAKDFDTLTLITAGYRGTTGIWSDGSTMWVVDQLSEKIYAFSMSSKARDRAKDFDTLWAAGNRVPGGIWSDGTTMWVTDFADNKIYAYSMPRGTGGGGNSGGVVGSVVKSGDFGVLRVNVDNLENDLVGSVASIMPAGYKVGDWNDLTTFSNSGNDLKALWDNLGAAAFMLTRNGDPTAYRNVSDHGTRFHAFYFAQWSERPGRTPHSGFHSFGNLGQLYLGSFIPGGRLLIVKESYGGTGGGNSTQTVAHGSSVAGSISAPGERDRYSVALSSGQTLTAYTTGSTDTFGTFEDSGGTSLATNDDGGSGTNFRLSHTVSAEGTYYIIVRGYSRSTTGNYQLNVSISGGTTTPGASARDSAKDFDTLYYNTHGLWSDGTTMWVLDLVRETIYAYNMSTKARDSAKDFDTLTAAGNRDPRGLWSDGTTMWVADLVDNKIYAYSMSTKARDSVKDFNTTSLSNRCIWSDGTTMWVADWSGDVSRSGSIYAYSMSTKARDSAKDFNTTLTAAGNRGPIGIWSDGTTMWVGDWEDDKIYAYSMAGM